MAEAGHEEPHCLGVEGSSPPYPTPTPTPTLSWAQGRDPHHGAEKASALACGEAPPKAKGQQGHLSSTRGPALVPASHGHPRFILALTLQHLLPVPSLTFRSLITDPQDLVYPLLELSTP